MSLITRFLIADDDADDSALFCEALDSIDPLITCDVAVDGRMALDLLGRAGSPSPQVIFLDINMPVMNGWQCLEKMKADPKLRSIPVIIYSTSSHRQDAEKAFKLGAVCLFTKPYKYKDLKTILSEIVNTPTEKLGSSITNSYMIFNHTRCESGK